jgi:hypothetical protein
MAAVHPVPASVQCCTAIDLNGAVREGARHVEWRCGKASGCRFEPAAEPFEGHFSRALRATGTANIAPPLL